MWLVLATVLVSGIGYGQTAAAPAKETEEAERIHITADSLVADDNEKFAEFSGNVKAVQGGTEITAD
ncbi:MAG: LptA/OstA family protein, partial [Thermodesulfobacteriota bacterium]